MIVAPTEIAAVIELTPQRHADARGSFSETWHAARFAEAGIADEWVQDNQSHSAIAGTIRGLHLQVAPSVQAKLVRVLAGRIFDVAVDLRAGSLSYGQWVARELSAAAGNQLYIPGGFAHGFLTLEPDCVVAYKVSAPYAPAAERSIIWNDPDLDIAWPWAGEVMLSDRDARAPKLADIAPTLDWGF